jgi:hypothetical protein
VALSACGNSSETISDTDATGDAEEYIIQKFDLKESNVEEETMPEELPTEVEDYDHWTRETEWCKIVETQNASIYANVDDEENLYVSWNGCFGKCSWEEARHLESDIEMTESDIDNDGEMEVLVIQHNNTGSNSGDGEFHLLDMNGSDTFTDSVIQMDDFWKWIKDISACWLNNANIGELYLYDTSVTESGLSIDAEIDDSNVNAYGRIIVQMVWKNKTLQVSSFTFTTDF